MPRMTNTFMLAGESDPAEIIRSRFAQGARCLVAASKGRNAVGWFFFWLLLFIRLFPAVSIAEMKESVAREALDAA